MFGLFERCLRSLKQDKKLRGLTFNMIENPITCQVNPYPSVADRPFLRTCSKPPRGEIFSPGFLSLDHFGEGREEREKAYIVEL